MLASDFRQVLSIREVALRCCASLGTEGELFSKVVGLFRGGKISTLSRKSPTGWSKTT